MLLLFITCCRSLVGNTCPVPEPCCTRHQEKKLISNKYLLCTIYWTGVGEDKKNNPDNGRSILKLDLTMPGYLPVSCPRCSEATDSLFPYERAQEDSSKWQLAHGSLNPFMSVSVSSYSKKEKQQQVWTGMQTASCWKGKNSF